MADYCGMYSIADNRGTPRGDILGDFLEKFENEIEPNLMPFLMCTFGVCEGHGTDVKVAMDMNGKIWFEHVLPDPKVFKLTKKEQAQVPRSTEVPGKRLTSAQLAFIRRLREPSKDKQKSP
jgi:hypothetical protein